MIALFIAAMTISIGIFALFFPQKASRYFGIETFNEGLEYVRAAGARDIFIGLAFLILLWRDDMLAVGYTSLGVSVVSFTDFILTMKHGFSRYSLMHLAGTFLVVGYGLFLVCL